MDKIIQNSKEYIYIYIYIYIYEGYSINKVNITKGIGNKKLFTVALFSRTSIVISPFIYRRTVRITFFAAPRNFS